MLPSGLSTEIILPRDDNEGTALRAQIAFFNTFSFLGVFLITAILLPALFSPNVRRSKPWFGQIIPWLVYSLSYLLIVGRQLGPEPSFGVCLFQSALIYASPPLCSVGTTCFVIEFYLQLTSAFSGVRFHPRWTTVLVFFPMAIYIAVFLEVILTLNNPLDVQRDKLSHLYCHVSTAIPSLVSGILVVLSGVVMFPLEIWMGIQLYRHWPTFRSASQTNPRISLSIFIRIILFTVTALLAVGMSAFIITRASASVVAWSVALPTLPTIAAIAFGTQKDILQVWMFWKKPVSAESTPVMISVMLESTSSTSTATVPIQNPELKSNSGSIGEIPTVVDIC